MWSNQPIATMPEPAPELWVVGEEFPFPGNHSLETFDLVRGMTKWTELEGEYEMQEEECLESQYVCPPYTLVDNTYDLMQMITALSSLPNDGYPWIGIDLEASDLGYTSPLMIMQIRDYKNEHSCIVDVLELQQAAWSTADEDGQTLKDILEDENILKLLFDMRADSSCLYGQYGIRLRGIRDVQILNFLCSSPAPRRRRALHWCTRAMRFMSDHDFKIWELLKNKSGAHGKWAQRPLDKDQIMYALGDVVALRDIYDFGLPGLSMFGQQIFNSLSESEVEQTWDPENYVSTRGDVSDSITKYWNEEEYPSLWDTSFQPLRSNTTVPNNLYDNSDLPY